MYRFSVNFIFLLLFLLRLTKCDANSLNLKIFKSTGDFITPVSGPVIEEKAGANFSLLCDLMSSETNNDEYDVQLSWIKTDVRMWRMHESENKTSPMMFSILQPSELNKAVKHFQPLSSLDAGKWLCVSLKYSLQQIVEIVVHEDVRRPVRPLVIHDAPIYCSEQMFQCGNGVCIIRHYICDGREDCRDGSDESEETCNTSRPCEYKLPCEDGRCIPRSWCCDINHDPNCTVMNRPSCCQILSEPYDDADMHLNNKASNNNQGGRYILISVCTLGTLIVILLFLVLAGRVMLMAQKSDLERSRSVRSPATVAIETISLGGAYYAPRGVEESSENDSSHPLLVFLPMQQQPQQRCDDLPPPYREAVAQSSNSPTYALSLDEAPPPYTSTEVINAIGRENS